MLLTEKIFAVIIAKESTQSTINNN